MKINCLTCGHNIDLDDAYSENYEGEIKCYGCGATLEIKTEQNAIRAVRLPIFRPRNEPRGKDLPLDDIGTPREAGNGLRAGASKI
jgi:DNA-directed RNA polymerase subunit RPC12/RpoP